MFYYKYYKIFFKKERILENDSKLYSKRNKEENGINFFILLMKILWR